MPRPSALSIAYTSIVILTFLFPSITSATCYWQNSTLAPDSQYSIAPDDVACFPDQENSPCCGTGWSCLSDGVCFIQQDGNDFYYRGTCTDRTWTSQECPGWCFAENNSTSWAMTKCSNPNGEDWYCCTGDPNCDCSSGKDAVKLGATQPVTATVIGSTSWPGIQSTTISTVGNIATSTVTDSVSSGTTKTVHPSASSATGTGTGVSAASNRASGTDNATGGNNTALAAGLGAGIGSAVALLAVAGFFFLRRSRRNRASAAAGGGVYNPAPGSSPGNHAPGSSGDGYYAAPVVNEKDGRQTYATQELDAGAGVGGYQNAAKKSGSGYPYYAEVQGDPSAVEMDTDTSGYLPASTGNVRPQGRAELP